MAEEEMEFEAVTKEDSSDSSSEDEDGLLQETTLTEKVSESPYEYENHVKLIKFFKEAGELQKLRDARNAMAQIFPLNEEIWLEWVQDEIKLASSDEEKELVLDLLERAVSDFLSIDLWLEYCQFTIGGIGSEAGLSKARDTYERAVSVGGLHVTRGSLLWDSYRVFENVILQSLQPQIGAVQSSEEQKNFEEQVKRVENIFRRQLCTPLLNMEETYEELQQFVTDAVPKDVTDEYNKALCQLKAYNKYEIALNKAASPRLTEYETYIRAIKTKGDVNRLQCLYERALVENWQNQSLWQEYTKLMDDEYRSNHSEELKDDENNFYHYHEPVESRIEQTQEDVSKQQESEEKKKLSSGDPLLMIHRRAVRNCPWSKSLWIGYLQALERLKQPHSEIKGVFEEAILAGFSSSSEYLEVWTAWLGYLKRRIEWKKGGAALQEFRDTVQRAIDFMNQYFGGQGDGSCMLQRYWAKVETHYNKNLEFGREQFTNILNETDNGYKAEFWLDYYQFELKYGDLAACRDLLLQAVDIETDWPQQICQTLLNFEREYGSLNSYVEASSKVQVILEAEEKQRLKAAKKAEKKMAKSGGNRNWQNKNREEYARGQADIKGKGHFNSRGQADNKGKGDFNVRGQKAYKGKGKSNQDQSKEPGGNDFSNQAKKKKQEKKKQPNKTADKTKEDVVEVKKEAIKRKAEAEPDTSAKLAKVDDEGFKVPVLPVSPKSPRSPRSPKPSQKAVAPTVEEKMETGVVKQDIEESEANEGRQKETSHQYKDDVTVFVKNLGYNITEEKIRNVFVECGEIVEVRMKVGNKNKFRGFCYVEFKNKASVEKAIKLDRHEIDGRPIYVDPSVDKSKGDKQTKHFKYDTSLDKKKLFISGLPRSVTKEDLQKMFSKYGSVKDVRIVTYRSGVPKGLAFVEYEKESEASSAVLGADGTVMGDYTISVAISNPPTRKPQAGTVKETNTPPVSLGAKGISGPRGKGRTQIALVPRAVQRPQTNKPKTETSETMKTDITRESDVTTKPKMSNADFAKMFLKK